MTKDEDEDRQDFLLGGEPPQPKQYWVVVGDPEPGEHALYFWFAYDPAAEGAIRIESAFRVALVEGAVAKDWDDSEVRVEETITRGARPPGSGWGRHNCFFTIGGNVHRRPGPCEFCDEFCKEGESWSLGWVTWRRPEEYYCEHFDTPEEFEQWFEEESRREKRLKRPQFKVIDGDKR